MEHSAGFLRDVAHVCVQSANAHKSTSAKPCDQTLRCAPTALKGYTFLQFQVCLCNDQTHIKYLL